MLCAVIFISCYLLSSTRAFGDFLHPKERERQLGIPVLIALPSLMVDFLLFSSFDVVQPRP
jgi:hypothetical protein